MQPLGTRCLISNHASHGEHANAVLKAVVRSDVQEGSAGRVRHHHGGRAELGEDGAEGADFESAVRSGFREVDATQGNGVVAAAAESAGAQDRVAALNIQNAGTVLGI